jgi:CHAD domain-containing protein
MSVVRERRRKYDVPAGFQLPDLCQAGVVAQVGPPVVHGLAATYLDTRDLRLARHRVTVRRRSGGGDAGWHVKVPGTAAGERVEYRAPLAGEDLPAALDTQVRALRRGAPLRPVARIRTTRRQRPLRDAAGRVLALLAEDDVAAQVSGTGPRRWHEVEVELVEGDPRLLAHVDRVLRRAGARAAAAPSKLARALADRLPDPPTVRADRVVVAVVGYARAQRDALLATDPAVRRGEPEAVHDMRVATRRLRSTLRTFRPLWNERRRTRVRGELNWLADQLGAVRDNEVMLARLTGAVHAEPDELVLGPVGARVREWLTADAAQARQRLLAALDSPRYLALLDALDGLLDPRPATVAPRKLVSRAAKALRRADADLDAARTDPQLHESRKRFKQARYAVEALRPVAGKPAKRLAKKLTELQDILGTHQDTTVTRGLLLDYGTRAYHEGDNAFTYGLLHARQQAAGQLVLGDLPAATRAARRRRLRRWLRGRHW